MKAVGDVLRDVNVGAFCILALACAVQWHRRRDRSLRWATLAFGSLAAVGILGLVMREAPATTLSPWLLRSVLMVLVLFPYLLYRFATAFQRPAWWLAAIANVSTAAVAVASLALPSLPLPGMPAPMWWSAYRIGILIQWSLLFTIVASRLWLAARHEALVVRRRMRTLALAAGGLNAIVLLSGVGPSTPTVTRVAVTQAMSLVSAVLFFVGLAPPQWLLTLWRRPEQIAFQGAMGALFRAEELGEMSAVLLPRAIGMVGAKGAALVSPAGVVLAEHGSIGADEEAIAAVLSAGDNPSPGLHKVDLRAGALLLWTSHYAPFFGPDEFAMLQSLGSFADIVMERHALADRHRGAQAALNHQATHDALTGLPNRVLLEDRLAHSLARSRQTGGTLAVLFLDVDRFKVINDSLGHGVGDQLLRVLARRLRAVARPEDTVARFGGDEFVVVTECRAGEDPTRLAARIAGAAAAPFPMGGSEVIATISIGVAVAGPSHDADSLLSDADAAMYQAKEQGRDRYVLFDRAMRDAAEQRLRTETALRRAIDRGELRVHYQPVVELPSGHIGGVEALVRWEREPGTLVPPDEFIPVAEETGLIIPLGGVVLREACRQVAEWRQDEQALAHLSLSVNLSARELRNPGIVEQVRDALASTGLDARHLCLEITETVLLDDSESTTRSLKALKDLGVLLSVDDFGTGYASLTYLKRLAVDILKIDRSFVSGLTGGPSTSKDRAIVAGVVDLAHAFGLTTVAEGVETAEQLSELNSLGCAMAQGYYFCRALSPADAAAWMRAWEERAGTEDEALVPVDGDHHSTRVLVVDDQDSIRELLRLTLEDDEEFEVVGTAPDGREAVALARHHQPDLVLLDLAMPGVGGLEALPLIHAVAPRARIVVLSGLEPAQVADRVRAQGAAGYLVKGDSPDRLLDDLHRLLAL